MRDSIARGLVTRGALLGPLALVRLAPGLYGALQEQERGGGLKPLTGRMDLASAYAIAVAEENAAGGRVVTAPTCGAAGVVLAVLCRGEDRISFDTAVAALPQIGRDMSPKH